MRRHFPVLIHLAAFALLAFGCSPNSPNATSEQPVDDRVEITTSNNGSASLEGPGCVADSCEPGELPPTNEQTNIVGGELLNCSTDPMTGWFRDGACRTNASDRGVHVVCGVMTDEFLEYTKAKGNDLSTPRGNFPGLRPGDQWCLCASRWEEARQDGYATPVVLEATNARAADILDPATLEQHATP